MSAIPNLFDHIEMSAPGALYHKQCVCLQDSCLANRWLQRIYSGLYMCAMQMMPTLQTRHVFPQQNLFDASQCVGECAKSHSRAEGGYTYPRGRRQCCQAQGRQSKSKCLSQWQSECKGLYQQHRCMCLAHMPCRLCLVHNMFLQQHL